MSTIRDITESSAVVEKLTNPKSLGGTTREEDLFLNVWIHERTWATLNKIKMRFMKRSSKYGRK
jgi:hypothetical protein